jgi:hypothetical protein
MIMRRTPEHEWADEEAGPIVRPYAVTGGRTRSSAEEPLDLVTIVETSQLPVPPLMEAGPEHHRIRKICMLPLSVAEIASELRLPVDVVRVLLDDLRKYGLVTVRRPAPVALFPDERVLKEVIDGLRAL